MVEKAELKYDERLENQTRDQAKPRHHAQRKKTRSALCQGYILS